MRVLLCDVRTGLYFRSPDQWTAEPALADDFGSSLKAAAFAHGRLFQNMKVLLDFDDPEYNVHLPLESCLSQSTGEASATIDSGSGQREVNTMRMR